MPQEAAAKRPSDMMKRRTALTRGWIWTFQSMGIGRKERIRSVTIEVPGGVSWLEAKAG